MKIINPAKQGQKPVANFKPTCDAKPDLNAWNVVKVLQTFVGCHRNYPAPFFIGIMVISQVQGQKPFKEI